MPNGTSEIFARQAKNAANGGLLSVPFGIVRRSA
jgi:hypothetical protein